MKLRWYTIVGLVVFAAVEWVWDRAVEPVLAWMRKR